MVKRFSSYLPGGAFPVLLAICLLVLAAPSVLRAEAMLYSWVDENGVTHVTNDPAKAKDPRYKPWQTLQPAPEAKSSDKEASSKTKNRKLSRKEIIRLAEAYSRLYDLDEKLVRAVIMVESRYNPGAVSPAGARGLMQIMPGTGQDLGLDQPFDPERNIEAGVKYLSRMLHRFGSIELALAAYNAGPAQVERYGGVPPFAETREYLMAVLLLYKYMK